mgnify:CR=1 FL=1
MNEAKSSFDSKDYPKAISLYNEAAKIDPRGKTPRERIDERNSLVTTQRSNEEEFQNLVKKADDQITQKSFDDAISNYNRALKIKPDASELKDKIRNADPKDLLPRMGVLTTVDKDGQSIVLAYGQSEIRKTSSRQSAAESRAFSQAANIARDNLKNFIAQDIALEEITENAEVLSSYADGSQDFFSQNKFEQRQNYLEFQNKSR